MLPASFSSDITAFFFLGLTISLKDVRNFIFAYEIMLFSQNSCHVHQVVEDRSANPGEHLAI
jgi:hypothetical protein